MMAYVYGDMSPVATNCIICVSAAVFSAILPVADDVNVTAAPVK